MSRESILLIWTSATQPHRSQPDASTRELFILLYGMLFTNIHLNDFIPTLARFLLSAAHEGSGVSAVRVITKCSPVIYHEDVREDRQRCREPMHSLAPPHVSPALSDANLTTELPLMFKLALQLMFSMSSFVLHNPTRKVSQFFKPCLNPPSTQRHCQYWNVQCRGRFTTIPRNVMAAQGIPVPAISREGCHMIPVSNSRNHRSGTWIRTSRTLESECFIYHGCAAP